MEKLEGGWRGKEKASKRQLKNRRVMVPAEAPEPPPPPPGAPPALPPKRSSMVPPPPPPVPAPPNAQGTSVAVAEPTKSSSSSKARAIPSKSSLNTKTPAKLHASTHNALSASPSPPPPSTTPPIPTIASEPSVTVATPPPPSPPVLQTLPSDISLPAAPPSLALAHSQSSVTNRSSRQVSATSRARHPMKRRETAKKLDELRKMLQEKSYGDMQASYLWTDEKKILRTDSSNLDGKPVNAVEDDHLSVLPENSEVMGSSDPQSMDAAPSFSSMISDLSLADSLPSTSTDPPSRAVWTGILAKMSPSMFKGWQDRYVVIGQDDKMIYKKTAESPDIAGEVPLIGASVSWKPAQKSSPPSYIIEVSYQDPKLRVFEFKTSSPMDRELVVAMIQDVIHTQNLKHILKLCKHPDDLSCSDSDDSSSETDQPSISTDPRSSSTSDPVLPPHEQLQYLLNFCTQTDRHKLLSHVDLKNQNILHICASYGASRCAAVILRSIPPEFINARSDKQDTPLAIALSKHYDRTALAILDHPDINVNLKTEQGDTYLHKAARSSKAVTERLLELGIDALETNVSGALPHHDMARSGNTSSLMVLLSHNDSVINQRGSKDGYSPLHWAAREAQALCVRMLLSQNADPSLQGYQGNAPLHVCIHHYVEKSKKAGARKSIKYHKNYTACIVALVEAGANLEDISREGRSALSALCRIEPEAISQGFGGEEAFKAMLAAKAKVNVRSAKGLMPLHYASIAGNWSLVKLLVKHGADVNAQGSDGFTALGYVEKRTNRKGARTHYGSAFPMLERTVSILLECGAIRRAHADVPIEENTNDIVYMRNNMDGTYQMKAATVQAMISRLTHRVFYSPNDVSAFLLQYGKFTTPLEILKLLEKRFFPLGAKNDFSSRKFTDDSENSDGSLDLTLLGERRSVLCFLEAWLASNQGNPDCFEDIECEEVEKLGEFSEMIMDTRCIPEIQKNLQPMNLLYFGDFVQNMHENLWAERWSDQHSHLVTQGRPTSGSTISTLSSGNFRTEDFAHYDNVMDTYNLGEEGKGKTSKASKLLGRSESQMVQATKLSAHSPQKLAQQLTLLVHTFFCEIPVEEFVDNRYRDLETGANFQRMKAMSNKLSFVLMSCVLAEEDMMERARVIKLLIQTAENCLFLENFDVFVSIISVLGSSAIHRLKQTWAKVDKLLPGKWDAIQKASGGAGRGLEKKMGILKPPCVPCIGLLLRMLINLNEEPSRTDAGLTNFHKLRKIGAVFQQVENAKSAPYTFAPDLELLGLLAADPAYRTEDEAWDRSRAIEAKLPT